MTDNGRKINERGADKMIIKNEGFTGYIEKCGDGLYVDVAEVGGADLSKVLKSYNISDQYIEFMAVGDRIEFTDTVTESIINKERIK